MCIRDRYTFNASTTLINKRTRKTSRQLQFVWNSSVVPQSTITELNAGVGINGTWQWRFGFLSPNLSFFTRQIWPSANANPLDTAQQRTSDVGAVLTINLLNHTNRR